MLGERVIPATGFPAGTSRTRLDFDGGPWLWGFPLSHTSPWAELGCAAGIGLLLGVLGLPASDPVRWLGWIPWALLTPVAAVVWAATWAATGAGTWVLGPHLLGPLGWALLSLVVADILQAVLPLSFTRRWLATAVASPALAAGVVWALSHLPWQRLPWSS
ncbi:MAG TPA: hypothetical protein VNE62_01855 [Actinomycetota bacterium]|nr:hypothetical protein [Actinomycetota bacterium]